MGRLEPDDKQHHFDKHFLHVRNIDMNVLSYCSELQDDLSELIAVAEHFERCRGFGPRKDRPDDRMNFMKR